MKVESTDKTPKFNLFEPDGERPQVHAEAISDVLLNDGHWYKIVIGSFKFYRTKPLQGSGAAVPFVQFDVAALGANSPVAAMSGKRVEVFPASIVGIAYRPTEGRESESKS